MGADRAEPQPAVEQAGKSVAAISPAAGAHYSPLAGELTRLQRLIGNRAVVARSAELRRLPVPIRATAGLRVQRDPPKGTVLDKADPAADTAKTGDAKKGVAPDSAPAKDRGTTPAHPAAPRPGFDLAGGQEILTKAFGKVKTIVPGSIQLLEAPAFKAAYDKIYGGGQWSWDAYVVPTYGSLNGFAHGGVNYINKASAGLHTVVHEMLHNNTAADWRGVVGSRWDEGTTELLTQAACKLFDEPAPVCYPGESPTVQVAIDSGLKLDDLEDAYLSGGAKAKVADWVDANCVLPWAKVKELMEAKNWAATKAALARKPAAAPTPATPATPATTAAEPSYDGAGVGSGTG